MSRTLIAALRECDSKEYVEADIPLVNYLYDYEGG